MEEFENIVLNDQQILSTQETCSKILELIPSDGIHIFIIIAVRNQLENEWRNMEDPKLKWQKLVQLYLFLS